ncbi:MAG TPA: 30S ribosomal protein S17e [Candidatus Methanofastidiosa archaeon]|nr:30S ribosomal protein S17e [Candidatus Methanofastidiosa archaeon]HPR41901.1 30S ribosomal protein S17e [Candidatus Methanofastidiosa archaeon]
MGRIRPRFIKRVASEILVKYTDELSIDYDKNRDFLEDVLEVPSQTVKNRIVGYVTTLKKQEERAKLS